MDTPPPSRNQAGAHRSAFRRVVAFMAMCFGMFMALLDIQIVSASLNEIQAGLAASADEIPWVQTAYLIAEVVAIPSPASCRARSAPAPCSRCRRRVHPCELHVRLSSSISTMIVWRAMQGFIGGGMVPTVFAAAF